MRLVSCHIENFGKMSDFSMDFYPGYNYICRPNGWGKTTLAAFIKVMLFGFDNKGKRSILENERARYTPWQNGVYGGELIFEEGGVEYSLKRTFGKTEKSDQMQLIRLDTGMVDNCFGENVGEAIFKLDSESFKKTAYIKAGDCNTSSTDMINAKLSNLSDENGDVSQYENAMKSLKDGINKMTDKRVTGELAKLNNSINELKQQISDRVADEYAREENELKRLSSEKLELEKEQKMLTKKYMNLLGKPSDIVKTKGDEGRKVNQRLIIGIGVAAFILSFVIAVAVNILAGIIALVAFGAVLTYVWIKKCKDYPATTGNGNVSHPLPNETVLNDMMEEIEDYNKRIMDVSQSIINTRANLEKIHDDIVEQQQITQLIKENEAEFEVKKHKYDIMCMTKDCLEEAKNKFVSMYRFPIKENFSKYYEILTGEKSDKIHIDSNLVLTVEELGINREQGMFSSGYNNILSIAMRMAMLKSMYGEDKMFIIFDEPFAHFDDDNCNRAWKFLRNSENDFQIIVFSCKGMTM